MSCSDAVGPAVYYLVAVDVGSASVRAGVLTDTGTLVAHAVQPIQIWHPKPDMAVQSSSDIWDACCDAVARCIEQSGIDAQRVQGLAFDATCSMVVLGDDDRPLSVVPGGAGPAEQNVIMWMDHRAEEQARRLSHRSLAVLHSPHISPEKQIPKLMWLHEHMPDTFHAARHFFDLADFLSYAATGCTDRSRNTVTAKWEFGTADDAPDGWSAAVLDVAAGLPPTLRRAGRIGQPDSVRAPGARIGTLRPDVARRMRLHGGVRVAAGLVDAHAGALPMLWAADGVLAAIAGTSACFLAQTPRPVRVPGIWGPFPGALSSRRGPDAPSVLEAGQSACGAALDALLHSHVAWPALAAEARTAGTDPYTLLWSEARALAAPRHVYQLAGTVHVLPDVIGNRSPLENPRLRAVVSGIGLQHAERRALAALYVAAVLALALGVRLIRECLAAGAGVTVREVRLTGGLASNAAYVQALADVLALPVHVAQADLMLLGGAACARAAVTSRPIDECAAEMPTSWRTIFPSADAELAAFLERKYRVMQRMYADQQQYQAIMSEEM